MCSSGNTEIQFLGVAFPWVSVRLAGKLSNPRMAKCGLPQMNCSSASHCLFSSVLPHLSLCPSLPIWIRNCHFSEAAMLNILWGLHWDLKLGMYTILEIWNAHNRKLKMQLGRRQRVSVLSSCSEPWLHIGITWNTIIKILCLVPTPRDSDQIELRFTLEINVF